MKRYTYYAATFTGPGTTSAPVMIAETSQDGVNLALFPGGEAADVEVSISKPAEVEAGTANWVKVITGATTNTLLYVEGPVTAIRLVANGTSATPRLEIAV